MPPSHNGNASSRLISEGVRDQYVRPSQLYADEGQHCAATVSSSHSCDDRPFRYVRRLFTSALDLTTTRNRRRHTACTRPDAVGEPDPARDVVGSHPRVKARLSSRSPTAATPIGLAMMRPGARARLG
jgi:hypothetical protein